MGQEVDLRNIKIIETNKTTQELLHVFIRRHSVINLITIGLVYFIPLFIFSEEAFMMFNDIVSGFRGLFNMDPLVAQVPSVFPVVFFGLIGVLTLSFMYNTFFEGTKNIPLKDIVDDLVEKSKPNGIKKEKLEQVKKDILCIISSEQNVSYETTDSRYNARVKAFFKIEGLLEALKKAFPEFHFEKYLSSDVPNYEFYQYFSSIDNMRKVVASLPDDDKEKSELLKQSIELEGFYESTIWTIGGIFITAAFSIIALSFNFDEIHPVLGALVGTGIFFIFYKIFMRFRVSLRLYRNMSRIYETAMKQMTIQYVYDIEFKKYGVSPRIREILLTVLYIMIVLCFVLIVAMYK